MPFKNQLEANRRHFEALDSDTVKRNGVAYTPFWLAEHITNTAFIQWEKFNRGMRPECAADICCGTGVFLGELIKAISRRAWPTRIFGFDIDVNAVSFAKSLYGDSKIISKIAEKDALLIPPPLFDTNKEDYDIIVGNPPYVNASFLDEKYKKFLKANYEAAFSGSFDLSVIFVEKVLKSLKQGGVASLILSNKFMTSQYGKSICRILASDCNIIKIEDFNDVQVFKGLTTYTCILTFIKEAPGKRHVFVRYSGEIDHENPKLPTAQEFTISHSLIKNHPWNFYSNDEAAIINKLLDPKLAGLEEVFSGVQQGVRTGANDVFILDRTKNELDDSELLKRFVSGENVKSIQLSGTQQRLIYPYQLVEKNLKPVSEEILRARHAETYKYLLKHKPVLRQRSLQGKAQWYAFSRSQSLDSVFKRKIFVREMMPKALFAADIRGSYAFSSGYAIICENMKDDEILAWAAILSTPTMEYVMRHVGTQLHSGWFRLMKNHLARLKLPKISPAKFQEIISLVSKDYAKQTQETIDAIVCNAFNLTKAEHSHIKAHLRSIHEKSSPQAINGPAYKNNDDYEPVKLSRYDKYHIDKENFRQLVTFSPNKKTPIHSWYKYTQGFSAPLVNIIIDEFKLKPQALVLDPFNGCGTTTTVCAYRGIDSVGIEISPLMSEVGRIKGRKWDICKIKKSIDEIGKYLTCKRGKRTMVFSEYLSKAYSPDILNSLIAISSSINQIKENEIKDFYSIALISIMEDVSKIRKHGSHYRFLDNPTSVGLQKLNISVINEDADIVLVFKKKLMGMYNDICTTGGRPAGKVTIINANLMNSQLEAKSIDAILTSPPYLNRNNYISQQKAELDILGLIANKTEYKRLVQSTFRSHTDSDLNFDPISAHKDVNLILKNIKLEDGNNPKIPHMICGYFIDLEDSLKECYRVLKERGKCSYVVGNARWGGIVVPIDHMLANIAEKIGFKVLSIYVTRLKGNSPQQMKRYGRIAVRESIVNLMKP